MSTDTLDREAESETVADKSKTATIRLSREIVRKARTIASYLDMSLPEWIEAAFGPVVDKEYERIFGPPKPPKR